MLIFGSTVEPQVHWKSIRGLTFKKPRPLNVSHMSLSRALVVLLLLTGCAPNTTTDVHVSTTVQSIGLTFDDDQWNGEVEWALIEECSLLGLLKCPDIITSMKAGRCSVTGTRLLLDAMADIGVRPAGVLVDIQARGDCRSLSLD